jgi:hypothetical protein
MQVLISAVFADAVNQWFLGLGASGQAVGTVLLTFAVSYAHNWLEDHGIVPTVLKGSTDSAGDGPSA